MSAAWFGWMRQAWVGALGWTLVHSVWQLAVLGLVGLGTMTAMRRASAQSRYAMGLILLLLMAVATGGTFGYLLHRSAARAETVQMMATPGSGHADIAARLPDGEVRIVAGDQSAISAIAIVERAIPCLVPCYLAVLTILTLRLVVGYGVLRQLGRSGAVLEGDAEALLWRLQRQMRIRRAVRLVKSAAVEVPTVLGVVRPLILVPALALTGLSAEHLEALLAHELAHVRRHDSLVNLVQSVIETVLFYHPAVWWLSRMLREEREYCCDDVAAAVMGSTVTYARALATMESLRAAPVGVPAGLALGARSGGLLGRIRRLLGVKERRNSARMVSISGVAVLIGLVTSLAYLMPVRAQDKGIPADKEKILLFSSPPVVADEQATTRPEPGMFVLDVRDLLTIIKLNDHPPTEKEVQNQHLEDATRLITLIEASVDPLSWQGDKRATIQLWNDRLLIRGQTSRNLDAIVALTNGLLKEQSIQISVETRLLLIDEPLFQKLSAQYPRLRQGYLYPDGTTSGDILDDKQLNEVLDNVKSSLPTISVGCPRLTLFSQQPATIELVGPKPSDRKSPMISINIEAAASPDAKTVALQFAVLLHGPYDHRFIGLTSVPDNAPTLFGGMLIPPRDSANTTSENRHLIVIIRPHIIIPSDLDLPHPK
jgi:beta-lactamase regulating signal transducer with metallopeptidase domain